MKKTILVATDFSPASLNAAGYAADMAKSIDADLCLLHVYQVPVTYGEVPVFISLNDIEEFVKKDMNDFKTLLIRDYAKDLAITTVLKVGSVFTELEDVCETMKPYAVIMGRKGATAAERVVFGSHTVYAMRHLHWPMITVPAGATFSSIKKIALACDFDKVIDTVPVEEIKLLVNDFKAELHVLNTGKQKVFNPDIVFESGLLQEMLAGLQPQYHFIAHEDTDQGIIEYAEQNHIDLLVVLPKRHELLDRLTHKSHTKQFVLHSHVPIMALHQ